MLRFHLDENVDHAVARGLRARGIDVTTSTDANLVSVDDTTQLAFAQSQSRVLVTHDGPLLGLATSGVVHAGIAYAAKDTLSIGDIIRCLLQMNACLSPEEMAGRIEYLHP